MMRKLLLLFILLSLTFPALAQDITFDGHNCKPGGGSEWGMPDYADSDKDGDGYGDRDTPTGTADVLNLWYRQSPQHFLLAFERRKTGNSYFAFYLNTDCDESTGDPARNGADISLYFDISPGITPEITNNTIYRWNNAGYVDTGRTFEAKVGMESCDGALGNFFEFRIPVADIFEACGNSSTCHNITLSQAASLAGGSPNSKDKDIFAFGLGFGINSDPNASIDAPDTVCEGQEFALDGRSSTYFNSNIYTEANAPDFMDSIVAYEWDLNYDGQNFDTDTTGESPVVALDGTGEHTIALRVTDAYGCSHLTTHQVFVSTKPVAAFNFKPTDGCGLQIAFDASASMASLEDNVIDNFEWDFNYTGNFNADANGESATWNFEACGTYKVALKITDNSVACNTHMVVQTVEVTDTEAPEFTVPEAIEIDMDSDPLDLQLTGNVTDATDNCQVASIAFEDQEEIDRCGIRVIERTWTVTDLCGNETLKTQIISTPQDVEAPTFNEELPEPALEVSCNAIPEAEVLTAKDNYTSELKVEFEETFEGQDDECPSNYTIIRVWTATDCAGNTVSHRQQITVTDNEAPTFDQKDLPQNTSVSCNAIPEAETLTATDTCDSTVEVEFSEATEYLNDCETAATITRTWTATDCSGNTAVHTQIIEVADEEAPSFEDNELPADITVSCDAIPAVITLTATDNCDSSVNVLFEEVTESTNDCGTTGTIIRTWTATDCAGNTVSHTQHIAITDEDAPAFDQAELPKNTTVSCDAVPEAAELTASDNCDTTVEVVFKEEVKETNSCGFPAKIHRTWTATDCAGNKVTHCQVITITDTTAPKFNETLPENITVSCDALPDAPEITATDNCDTMVEVVFKEEVKETNSCGLPAKIHRTWIATDCAGNRVKHCQVITIIDTTAPEFNETLPENVTVSCDALPDIPEITATDNCDTMVEVVFNEVVKEVNSCGLPAKIHRTWTATDCAGNKVTHCQVITITDTMAPKFNEALPENITVSCDALPEAPEITAGDNCDTMVEVVFKEEIKETNSCGLPAKIHRTWTATDCAGNKVSHCQVITITDNTAPTFNESLPGDITISCEGESPAQILTASDTCSGEVSVSFEENISKTTACGTAAEIIRTWTATDCSGNTTSHMQVVKVVDDEAPEFNQDMPGDITVSCSTIPEASNYTATDNCDMAVTVDLEETITKGNCPGEKQVIRTWTATDCAGNTNTHTQVITVEDNEAPALVGDLDTEISVTCGNIPEVPELKFEDGCSNAVSVSFESLDDFTSPTEDYMIERIWTVSDGCGNSITYTQSIFVMNEAEVITLQPLGLCISDAAKNLSTLLPDQNYDSGTWEVLWGNYTIKDDIFDPFEASLGNYTLRYVGTGQDCPVIYEIDINVHDDCVVLPCSSASDIVISKAVTPNGDGYNDYFKVTGIGEDCGFRIKVTIFNKWEQVVYESDNYQNNWSGTAPSNAVGSSGQLPAGTYYYVVTLIDSGLDPFTGYIYLGTGS